MKEEKDKLRDFMQGVFHDYEVAPDPEEWNRIEKTLSKGKGRRFMMWAVWASAACLLVLLALYTGGILNRSENTTVLTSVNLNKTDKASAIRESNTIKETNTTNKEAVLQSAINESKKSVENINHKAKTAETKSTLLASPQIRPSVPVISPGKNLHISTILPAESFNSTENNNLLVHAITPRTIASVINLLPGQDRSKDFIYKFSNKNSYPENKSDLLASNSPSVKFKGLSLSNSSGLITQASSKDFMSYDGTFASQLASNMFVNSVKVFDNSYLASLNIGGLFQNNNRNYLPPITFGLNVNLSLPNNWSIETGIQYTRLQSNGRVSINSSNTIQFTTSFGYHVDENLYYIGVPVIVNYNLAQKRKTSFYLSAGISIEKGIIAKYIATPEDNFPGMQPIYSHNTIRGLQYSANSGIGISYKFIRHFELFGQPSVTYYFKSDGKNTTIYSVHPMIFNLRTGIRYTIK